MIYSYECQAKDGPYNDKNKPDSVPEWRHMLMKDPPFAHHPRSLFPPAVHQENGYEVLDRGPGVRPCDPDQHRDVCRDKRDDDRGHQHQGREQEPPDRPMIELVFVQEKRHQVIAQRDAYDGEIGAEREDGEQRDKILERDDGQDVALEEVERVDVLDFVALEREDGRDGEEEVEEEDEDVVAEQESSDALLGVDGRDEGG